MNASKRKRIDAIITLVEGLIEEEKQDLDDTPDNIEHSEASTRFRYSIRRLSAAAGCLAEAKGLN